jgi:enoyl-CoA hydratase/carnithine racemase
MADPEVVLERRGPVARIVLNRPERRNALGRQTLPALHAVLDEVERDPTVGAVIVTGRGPVFCAGGDVDEIMSPEPTDREREFELIRGYNRLAWRLHHLDPPVVAAVNGPAAGGGAALAMACDIAIAAERARYDFVFGRIGLSSADMGCTYLLPRLVGRVRASYLVLTHRSVSAREGLALGLFAEVVPDERLEETAMALAERIAAGPRRANIISKLALRRAEHVEFGTELEYEAYLQSFAFRSEDHKQRLGAFRAERRRPKP